MFNLDFPTVPEPSTLIALILFGSILLTRSRSKN
ncbi:MAG: PEP-CTERM sorting domain-containing protein [Microcystis aeruginosa]|nr:PEP-CTERM sorting domain-containing protein [Microcystis aeruginosa]MDB9423839.1 PEP-CTERM sorting domain-containing protein [Microcystis aeruginosa CS-564/01]